MKIYYDDDAQIEIIKNKKVSIIGYGSQGHAHANNLNDSGVDITVGLREGSSSWKKAQDAGLKVASVSDSVVEADMVMILAPDEFQKGIYENQIKPNLKPNAILGFAHGFNIHFEKITPEKGNSVISTVHCSGVAKWRHFICIFNKSVKTFYSFSSSCRSWRLRNCIYSYFFIFSKEITKTSSHTL